MFSRYQDNPPVIGHMDADYVGNSDNKRSATSYVFSLARGSICWRSMNQSLNVLSTTETEYMVVVEVIKEALWLTGMVKEMSVQKGGVQLQCYSQECHLLEEARVSCKDRSYRCGLLHNQGI